ncbi:MAG TPA: serine hydrolase [Puia sp.]|uniref:serine hydrolase n=1 Tax=Puia sp. TaxID=2045100 RepID=UPI002C5C01A3|nr:serine hydrolase [Puia sp.]HVU93755.1 serine hydrolase [Puia sp.]
MRRSPLFILVPALLLVTITLNAQKKHPSAGRFAGLDTTFARVLKDWHAAGFAVAVVEKDSIVYAKGFGYKDFEQRSPVTPNTVFAIGSCTKAFTASLIGLLQKQELVDIDKPVRQYLPELKFYNTTMDNMITLRDMMCHRTGLSRYETSWFINPPGSRDSLIRRVQYMEPTAGVRERWQYNNFMFLGQGLVVEKVTGRSWEKNIQDSILTPLGMTHTGFTIDDLQKSPDHSYGYEVKKDSILHRMAYHRLPEMAPAGAINSTVVDLSAWLRLWLHNGSYKGREVLPAGYAAEATSVQMAIGGGLPSKDAPDIYFNGYGFGWFIDSYRGHYRVEHGGNIDGFSANICFFPADSIGIVVLSNQNNSPIPAIVRNFIADRLLHAPYRDWESERKSEADKSHKEDKAAAASRQSNRQPKTHPSHPLGDYAGLFANPAYGNLDITLSNDSLVVHLPYQKWWLKHFHYDVFEPFDIDSQDGIDTTDHGNVRFSFGMDELGNITTVTLGLDDRPVPFTRVARATTLTPEQLNKYTGEFLVGESLTVTVSVKRNTLCLTAPGQGEYELAPIDTDKFAFKTVNGFYIQFQLDAKGTVTGLTAIRPSGNFKATKKK